MPHRQRKFMYTAPTEGFMLMMKIGALGGLFVALPVIILQFWLFIAPGLYSQREEVRDSVRALRHDLLCRPARPSPTTSRFPYSWKFFLGFETTYIEFLPKICGRVLALGEDAARLRRHLPDADDRVLPRPHGDGDGGVPDRHTKYAVLIIFILGAVLSPGTDVVSQAMMAGPMLALYALSIVIAWLFAKKRIPAED